MRMFQIRNPEKFDETPEMAMGVHFARSNKEGPPDYIVVGGCVAVEFESAYRETLDEYLSQPWLQPHLEFGDREESFLGWLRRLPELDFELEPFSARESVQPILIRPHEYRGEQVLLGYIVGPLGPLPSPPPRPASIYGHLPFGATTAGDSVIYRWEAFPNSRRVIKDPLTGEWEVIADTYAAPASEVPFAPTGFGAVARFALPNLLPACFRLELKPPPSTFIECGASVPLYGQSGGGVEIRFPKRTKNIGPVANPVILPVM